MRIAPQRRDAILRDVRAGATVSQIAARFELEEDVVRYFLARRMWA